MRVKPRFAREAVRAAGLAAFPGFRLRVLARTPSTQDVVRAAARSGAAEGFCCVAMEQTAGRGRAGRRWEAPAGAGLLVSLLLRPRAAVAGGVPLAVGLAVADAVAALGAPGVGLKWPNDVLAPGGGKLAGVLVEVEPAAQSRAVLDSRGGAPAGRSTASAGAGGSHLAIITGIGLNLTVDAFPEGIPGASLHHLAGRAIPWEEALAALLPALATRLGELDAGGIAATAAAWRERAVGIGAAVTVQTPQGPLHGTATGIADDGALLLDTADGTRHRVLAGDVLLGPTPRR